MVKGIDAQHLVTQTYVAEKVQQVQQRQADLQQHYFDVQLAEERKRMKEKIKQSEESERMKLKERKERKEKEQREKNDQDREGLDEDKHVIDLKA
ncbi:MAG: hypothetical protein PHN75_01120 [Syntrophales bacterium]|nr:hypothetical protein [Syntrophales bacterium]